MFSAAPLSAEPPRQDPHKNPHYVQALHLPFRKCNVQGRKIDQCLPATGEGRPDKNSWIITTSYLPGASDLTTSAKLQAVLQLSPARVSFRVQKLHRGPQLQESRL